MAAGQLRADRHTSQRGPAAPGSESEKEASGLMPASYSVLIHRPGLDQLWRGRDPLDRHLTNVKTGLPIRWRSSSGRGRNQPGLPGLSELASPKSITDGR